MTDNNNKIKDNGPNVNNEDKTCAINNHVYISEYKILKNILHRWT